ncbi:hypothetical protein [Streptomyces sp. NPDC007369]|uniref:hypothetical protein n=1 Tax=Streptomyces sp. NPDC007369 TaxID=3154589 RepID=UPI00340AD906
MASASTGTYIDGLIEARTAGGAWEMEVDLLDFDFGNERDARECLFDYGGGIGVQRSVFGQRGWPEDACDEVPKECSEWNHSHSYATGPRSASVDWDAPLCDGPSPSHLGEWRSGPDGELVWDDVVWASIEVLDAAEELFGGDLHPSEWPPGGEVHLHGAVYRPVVLTAGMFVPPDGRWAPAWASMRPP